ncbi:MAG: hypothetical protein ACRDBM_14035 [Sporomusa sp.]
MFLFLNRNSDTDDRRPAHQNGAFVPYCSLAAMGPGCAGGVAGIARAAQLACSQQGGGVLLVAVELCSLTFQCGDWLQGQSCRTSQFAGEHIVSRY